ncbi:MAG: cache domain-containing protein, partial [Candidatus Marinimicrobia bacterium]|nr:cache domain-containing protein [Candidatus Neomarinimicrobiota bacterium]
MKTRKSISRIFYFNMMIALIIPLVVISIFTISQTFINFKQESKEIREQYINHQKTMIKNEVYKVCDFIEFERLLIENYLNEKIISKTDLQQEILEKIGKIRFGENGYIFVVSYDGVTLMNDTQRNLIGKNIWNLEDPNGVKVIQEERKAVENPEGDFIHYVWNKPTESSPSPKISFMKGIPEWQWMIGAGVYVDEIDTIIAQKRALLGEEIKVDLLKFGFLFVFLTILFTIIAKRHSIKIKKSIQMFSTFFQKAEIEHIQININNLDIPEFKTLAVNVNHMIKQRNKAEEELKKHRDHLEELVKERTEELEEVHEQLIRKERLAVLGQLSGGVGHDLRNPLGVISNSVFYLNMKLKDKDEKVKKHLALLKREIERSENMLSDLLDFSRGNLLNITETNVNTLIK